jgi:hypothetical protein
MRAQPRQPIIRPVSPLASSFGAYPSVCLFPGCERPAPLSMEDDMSLCAEHERLRFYLREEFARCWDERDPDRASQARSSGVESPRRLAARRAT